MDSLTTSGTIVKRRRLKNEELSHVFTRIKKPQEYLAELSNVYLNLICEHLKNNPKLGPKRLSDLLMCEGISLRPNWIYMLLIKHKLNRRSLRESWSANQEEMNP